MNINWNLQGCGGVPTKQPSMESMDIFCKQTISIPVMDSQVHKDGAKKGTVKLQMAVADLREGEGYPLSYWQKFITYIYIYFPQY